MGEAGGRFGPWRREVGAYLELFAVSGIAVAQPAFDLLGDNAGLFVAWRARPGDVVLLTACFVLALPSALWLIEVAVGLVLPAARSRVHALLVGLVVAVIALEVLKHQTGLGPVPLVVLAVPLGLGFAWLVLRARVVRTWLHVLAVAPVAFAVLFLFASPVHGVVFRPDPPVARVEATNPKRVVVLVMDELPLESLLDGNGAIDAELFPGFARLAGDATWYRNNTTVAAYTEAAVPAILTGRMPHGQHTVPVAAEHPRSLFTLLGAQYDVNVHESITRLCSSALCGQRRVTAGVHSGLRGMFVDAAKIWRDFASPERSQEVTFTGLGAQDFAAMRTGETFVQSLRPARGPRLDFLHVLLPHFPWHYLPSGQDYTAYPSHTNGLDGQLWPNDRIGELARVGHLLQVQAADTLLGRVLDRLEQIDAYDDALVVVTADHGASFAGGKPFRGLDEKTYPSILWTPLLVKAPGKSAGVVDDRPARSVDVLPTIADHLGVRLPWTSDGVSLLGAPRADGDRPVYVWERDQVRPEPDGDLAHFDGSAGFAAVLRRRAAPPGGAADQRVFRIGPHADLVGRAAHPLVVAGGDAAIAVLDDPLRYQLVDHSSARAPWAAFHGTVAIPEAGQPLAMAVNGYVVGLTWTYGQARDGTTEFWGTLPPSAFHAGKGNLLQLFAIDGTPGAERLRPITLTSA